MEEFNLGKNRGLVDQFLLLGFGTRRKGTAERLTESLSSAKPTLDDKKTVELELAPKSEEVLKQFSKIQIWFDESCWLPVQQQFIRIRLRATTSIVRYSKIVRNPNIPESAFKPHWPKGTEKIKH